MRLLALLALVVALAQPVSLRAQVTPPSTRPPQQQPQPEDTIPVPPFRYEPPVSPLAAFGRSFLLPGWGQAVLGRRVTGAVFITFEGLTATMLLKSVNQLHYQEKVGAETVEEKKKEVQDWLVLLVFNHLIAGAEAYVSALLWDFPAADLNTQVLPSGDVGFGVSLYWADVFR